MGNESNSYLDEYGIDIKIYEKEKERDNKFQIPINKDIASHMSIFTAAIPTLAANHMADNKLSGAYSVTFRGRDVLPGELFKKNNGSLMSNLKGENGKFGKQTDINPMDVIEEKGALAASSVLAVAAMVTSQYYMKNIDDKLEDIQANTKRILEYLEHDKQSQVEADLEILKDIADNLEEIKANQSLKSVKIEQFAALQRDAKRNIKFYEKQIDVELQDYVSGKKDDDDGNAPLDLLKKDFFYYKICLQEYALSKLIEIQLTDSYDEGRISNIRKEIDEMSDKYKCLTNGILNDIYGYHIDSVTGKVLQGISKSFGFVGNLIEKTPIGSTGIDENLNKLGEDIGNVPLKHAKNKADQILTKEDYGIVDRFSAEIKRINCTYNKPLKLVYDTENEELFFEVEVD